MNIHDGKTVLEQILCRLDDDRAQDELLALGPIEMDWRPRVREACLLLVPRVCDIAEQIKLECERTVNSASTVRQDLANKRDVLAATPGLGPEWADRVADASERAANFIDHLESQQISAEVQRIIAMLLEEDLVANGNSIYPDFYIRGRDYSFLPYQNRKNPVDGPCKKGTANPRPSNVPDGLELKTNKGDRIRVDAHGAHPGLHIGVTWSLEHGSFRVLGIYLSYIRIFDHRMSGGRVAVTTKKASFGQEQFIPVLTST